MVSARKLRYRTKPSFKPNSTISYLFFPSLMSFQSVHPIAIDLRSASLPIFFSLSLSLNFCVYQFFILQILGM
ncbi:hypothetical protein RchiOBHm_Chr4g0412321 [Rosa chinensis]|uniref:Uncharacterized protein n=1 Tax=Rosa chinensis TaxID=74649 RepID=A0A2P6QVV4_ROSCH|nr:hypothetical protein RchiOBHm_Chr4g0412321 [Rosa chinensis]